MALLFKMTGAVCVMGAAIYFAGSLNQMLENRKIQLRKLYSLLLQLKSEIQYMQKTLPECFIKLSDMSIAPFKEWMDLLSNELQKQSDASFKDIWLSKLEYLQEKSCLVKEDIEPLKELGDKLGNMDMASQLKAIDYTLLHIEKNRIDLENEMNQRKKVVVTLSLFGGFMTLILLL